MSRPRSVRFGLNVFWNLLGQALLLLLSFFLVPYLIRNLGLEGYALYGLMGVLSGYLCLLSFGAGGATSKFVSEYMGRKDAQGLWDVLTVSFLLHTVAVGAASVAAFCLRGRLALEIFHVSPAMRAEGTWILGCAASAAVFYNLTLFSQAALQGMQLFAESNVISLLQIGCILGGSALLLKFGFGLRTIGCFYVAVQVLLASLALTLLLRRLPAAPQALSSAGEPARRKRFLAFSLQGFLAQLGWSATFQWDKIIIGYFSPLSQLTYYLVPSSVMQRFWVLPVSIAATAFPLISEMHGAGEHASLRKVYRQCGQLILWISVPGYVFLFILAPQFLTLWLGAQFSENGVWPLRWLLLGYALYYMALMPNTASTGTNKPHYTLAWQTTQAALCVLFWFLLIPRMGIVGAALGFFLTQLLTGLPYAWWVSRELFGMSFWEYLEGIVLRPLAAGVILLALLWPLHAWVTTWRSLFLLAGLSTVLYYGAGFWLLGDEERQTLERLLRGFLR